MPLNLGGSKICQHMIRLATTEDAAQICDIYNHYVEQTTITFEEQPVAPDEMEQGIAETLKDLPWLVREEGGTVQGFAFASKWKGRCAYRYSVESTVYLRLEAQGRGIGSKLYQEILFQLSNRRMHTVMAGIALPNDASIKLHEKLGFEKLRTSSKLAGSWESGSMSDTGNCCFSEWRFSCASEQN